MSSAPREIGRSTVHQGRRLGFDLVEFEGSDGRSFRREMVRHPGAVCVLPIHDAGTAITLIRTYRFVIGGWSLELCAGGLEAGEPPARCAERELLEETGLRGGRVIDLGSFWTTPGITDERMHAFAVVDPTAGEQELEAYEQIETQRVSTRELWRLIDTAELEDGKSIVTLMRAWRRGLLEDPPA